MFYFSEGSHSIFDNSLKKKYFNSERMEVSISFLVYCIFEVKKELKFFPVFFWKYQRKVLNTKFKILFWNFQESGGSTDQQNEAGSSSTPTTSNSGNTNSNTENDPVLFASESLEEYTEEQIFHALTSPDMVFEVQPEEIEEGEILEDARDGLPGTFHSEENQQDGTGTLQRSRTLSNIISALITSREINPRQTNFFSSINPPNPPPPNREDPCEFEKELPAHFRGLPSALGNALHLGQPSCSICFCILTDASNLPCGNLENFNF